MKKSLMLPRTDSIRELARFWDSHDITDFADQLDEVKERLFARGRGSKPTANTFVSVPLSSGEVRKLERLANSTGVSPRQLIRRWIVQRITPRRNGRSR